MRPRAIISATLGATLALSVAPGPALAGVSLAYLDARGGAVEVVLVNSLGPDNAQYRQWLLKHSKRNSKAADALKIFERQRRSETLSSEEQKILNDFHAEFSTDRQNRFRAYLRQKALNFPLAGAVLDYEDGKGKPNGMLDADFEVLRKNLADDFKEKRERETDFVGWVRKQTKEAGFLTAYAKAVIAKEDGEAPEGDWSESEEADARKLLLKVYNENKKEFVKKYVAAREGVKTALDDLVTTVKNRRSGAVTTGQGALVLGASAREKIVAAFGELDLVEQEGEDQFGSTSWRNILGADSDAVDEQGSGLIMQSKIEGYCGQCSVAMLGDLGNIDDLMANADFQEQGTYSNDLVLYLKSRGFNAASVEFNADDRLAMSKAERLVMRRKAIDGALAGTRFPIIISINNDDDFLTNLEILDAFNKETAMIMPDGLASQGAMETVMGEELWNRLQEVKDRSSYNHWIVLSNIGQIKHRGYARILDPDAGVYDTPLERIVNAKRFEIVYVNPNETNPPK